MKTKRFKDYMVKKDYIATRVGSEEAKDIEIEAFKEYKKIKSRIESFKSIKFIVDLLMIGEGIDDDKSSCAKCSNENNVRIESIMSDPVIERLISGHPYCIGDLFPLYGILEMNQLCEKLSEIKNAIDESRKSTPPPIKDYPEPVDRKSL